MSTWPTAINFHFTERILYEFSLIVCTMITSAFISQPSSVFCRKEHLPLRTLALDSQQMLFFPFRCSRPAFLIESKNVHISDVISPMSDSESGPDCFVIWVRNQRVPKRIRTDYNSRESICTYTNTQKWKTIYITQINPRSVLCLHTSTHDYWSALIPHYLHISDDYSDSWNMYLCIPHK